MFRYLAAPLALVHGTSVGNHCLRVSNIKMAPHLNGSRAVKVFVLVGRVVVVLLPSPGTLADMGDPFQINPGPLIVFKTSLDESDI